MFEGFEDRQKREIERERWVGVGAINFMYSSFSVNEESQKKKSFFISRETEGKLCRKKNISSESLASKLTFHVMLSWGEGQMGMRW